MKWTLPKFWLFTLGALFLVGCSSFLYYPIKNVKIYEPEKMHLAYRDVFFKNQAGTTIHGWWFEVPHSKGSIVFFHGNAQNLTSHFLNLAWIVEKGWSFFIFDYPGYGLSGGKPNPADCVDTGITAVRWVSEQDKRPLVIYGQSLGGNIALRTALEIRKEIPFRAIVADSTFLSYQKIARKKLSLSWITWLFQPLAFVFMSDHWAPKHIADLAPIPTLVIAGQRDRVVEPEFSEQLFLELSEPKQILRVAEGGHGDVFFINHYANREPFLRWLAHPEEKVFSSK